MGWREHRWFILGSRRRGKGGGTMRSPFWLLHVGEDAGDWGRREKGPAIRG